MFQVDGSAVVQLGAQDVEALRALVERCHAFMTLVYGALEPDAAEAILESLPPGKTLEDKFAFGLYAEGKKELLGVLDAVRGFPEQDEWIIGLLMIDPDHRRAGLGARFVGAFEQWVRGQGAAGIRLVVQEQNPDALRFWQRQGYEVTGMTLQKTPRRQNLIQLLHKPLAP
ncbi:GNAT family N-acetyltransferase [Archangium violaceum]|uniref:GNAT family N-acetyltransferase n=1 Tax=Archangium violaceum TaxID=83451 RepID=UPI00194E0659|nr:GNAT family N-acetyltransferase [Archangium violaceum]QRO01407.1 GNAT family N-acetyltransferase [Archangium violaceum]